MGVKWGKEKRNQSCPQLFEKRLDKAYTLAILILEQENSD